MLKWLKILLNVILPPRCLICGKVISSDDSLCLDCFDNINFITKPYCKRCGVPLVSGGDETYCVSCLTKTSPLRLCRAAIKYDEFSKKLILDFKFLDHIENKKLLARWLYMAGQDIFKEGVDLLIPVPLYYTRLIKRKYNQSAILTAELAKLSGIEACYTALKKIKHTLPQVECNGKHRKLNVQNAFDVLHCDKIKGKRIVLIDDVYTTGSTLKECAKALKKAGAKSVDALTVARVCKK